MNYHIVYDKEDGNIQIVYTVYDGVADTFLTLESKDVLSTLSDLVPEPEKVDVLKVDIRQPLELIGMRVNLREKKLERIPPERK